MMKDEDKKEFQQWYTENRNTTFVLLSSLIHYCQDDVILLFENVLVFIEKMFAVQKSLHKSRPITRRIGGNGVRYTMNQSMIQAKIDATQKSWDRKRQKNLREGVSVPADRPIATISDIGELTFNGCNLHPFTSSNFTLSSLAYNTVRLQCLSDAFCLPNLTNDIPPLITNRSSKLEIQYLVWIKTTVDHDLIMGYGGGQQAVFVIAGRKMFVDGWSPSSQTVYEFLGCHVHGCRACFPKQNEYSCFGTPHVDNYYKTMERNKKLQSHPDIKNLVLMWQCSWSKLIATDPSIKDVVSKIDMSKSHQPLAVRQAFRGGLCGPSSVFMDVDRLAGRLSQVTGSTVEPAKLEAVIVDINSSYISRIISTKYGGAMCDTECIKIPANSPKILISQSCYEECSEKCNQMHECDPNHCQLICMFAKYTSAGKTHPNHPRNADGSKQQHECHTNTCLLMCLFAGRPTRSCARVDPHQCLENINCTITCLEHHSPSDYGKAPGVIVCVILAPQHIRYPILRIQVKTSSGEERQVSTLCTACAQEKVPFGSVSGCQHEPKDRQLHGTWMLSEVSEAVTKYSYILVRVDAVFFYPTYQNNTFRPFLELLAKEKIRSSGLPDHVQTDHEKSEYVEKIKTETGFSDLTIDDFKKDLAYRTLCKTLLVSVIGKTGQNQLMSEKKIVYTNAQLRSIQNNGHVTVKYYKVISDNSLMVFYDQREDLAQSWGAGNCLIAAEVTAFGRMDLLRIISPLDYKGWTSVYSDTDSSLMVKLDPNAEPLEKVVAINNNRIGSCKIEVSRIMRYVGTSPKSYCVEYMNDSNQRVSLYKVKGFSFINQLLPQGSNPMTSLLFDALYTSHVSNWSKSTSTKMSVFQAQLRIDPITLIPGRKEVYKSFKVCGPQALCQTRGYVQFPSGNETEGVGTNVSHDLLISKPSHADVFKSALCQPVLPKHQQHQHNDGNVEDGTTSDNTLPAIPIAAKDTCGLIPCVPFGFTGSLPDNPLSFETLAFVNE